MTPTPAEPVVSRDLLLEVLAGGAVLGLATSQDAMTPGWFVLEVPHIEGLLAATTINMLFELRRFRERE